MSKKKPIFSKSEQLYYKTGYQTKTIKELKSELVDGKLWESTTSSYGEDIQEKYKIHLSRREYDSGWYMYRSASFFRYVKPEEYLGYENDPKVEKNLDVLMDRANNRLRFFRVLESYGNGKDFYLIHHCAKSGVPFVYDREFLQLCIVSRDEETGDIFALNKSVEARHNGKVPFAYEFDGGKRSCRGNAINGFYIKNIPRIGKMREGSLVIFFNFCHPGGMIIPRLLNGKLAGSCVEVFTRAKEKFGARTREN